MAKKGGVSGKTHTRQQLNDFANQHNPNNKAYRADRENRAAVAKRNAGKHDCGILDGESYGWCSD